MRYRKFFTPVLLFLLLPILPVQGENWPQWRGPNFNGSTEATGLPVEFSKTKNVKWVADMPGPSASTPVIWEDKVFVSSTDVRTQHLLAICLDRETGKELWRRETGVRISRDNRSNFASPSPVTDGSLVYFFYGTGDLFAFDLDGNKAWSRNIQQDYGEFAFLWTFSTSPLLYDNVLYMQVLQRDVPVQGRGRTDGPNESYLLALNPKTGEELWRHVRPSEARAESLEAFSTPVPFTHNGRTELLVIGGDAISGHDPENGNEFWRWGSWNPDRITHWRLVPSPVTGGGVILACAPKNSPVYAVKAGLRGSQDDSALAWTSSGDRDVSSDVPTPLFYNDRFFILNKDGKKISCVEPATGKVIWTGDLGRVDLEASPTGADGKIYVMNHAGEVWVLEAGDEFKILHQTSMGDADDRMLRSTIAVAHNKLFIRTDSKLYCIANMD